MKEKERIILHIDMDYFFAQIEERENPHFKGKPVVVGADPKKGKGRGVVSTANYVARKYGIHSALPISIAYQLCPKAIFLPVNLPLYQKVSQRIMKILKKYSAKMEIVSLDEAYLDISFLKSYQKAKKMGQKIKKEIFKKEGLTSTIGIAPNKLIAKMASEEAKPDGLLAIKPKDLKKFLDPLNIEKIPGIGPKTAQKLKSLGCYKIFQLKKVPKEKLKNLFGKIGEQIWKKARGIDENPINQEKIIKSIGKSHTFSIDTRDPDIIFKKFDEMLKEIYEEIIKNKFSLKTITVVCRFADFQTHSLSKTPKGSANTLEILKKETKKMLLKFLLKNLKPIRMIALRFKIKNKI